MPDTAALPPSTRLHVVDMALAELIPYPGNPRRGNIPALKESLELRGQYKPLVVQLSTRFVCAGNHLLLAMTELGWETAAVVLRDLNDAEAAALVLADNRLADLGGYADADLLGLLQTVDDLTGTFYDTTDIDRLLAAVNAGTTNAWDEWSDMPAYDADDEQGVAKVSISFATEADAEAFFKLIDRPRRARMWWPQDDGIHRSNVGREADVWVET